MSAVVVVAVALPCLLAGAGLLLALRAVHRWRLARRVAAVASLLAEVRAILATNPVVPVSGLTAEALTHGRDAALAAMAEPDERAAFIAAYASLAAVPAGELLAVAAALAVDVGRGTDVLVTLSTHAGAGGPAWPKRDP